MNEIGVLIVNMHSRLGGYIGGGGFALMDLLKADTTESRVKFVVLENSPTLKEHYGLSYDIVGLHGRVSYEKFLEGHVSLSALLSTLLTTVDSILLGTKAVKERRLSAILSPNERAPNIISAFTVARLTHRPCLVMLHLLPGYEYALAAIGNKDFGIKSLLSFRIRRFGRIGLGGFVHVLLSFLACSMARVSICIVNNARFEVILRAKGGFTKTHTCALAGVDTDQINAIRSEGKPYDAVYVAGLISREKGIFDLLKSWRLVLQQLPSARLLILGKAAPGLDSQIYTFINQLGITNSVDIPYALRDVSEKSTVIECMKKGRVFLYPSIKDATPIVVMEALASGLPVVMYDAEYATGAFDPSTFLRIVKTGDLPALVHEFINLLSRGDDTLGEKAIAYARRFNNPEIANNQLRLMVRIIRSELEP